MPVAAISSSIEVAPKPSWRGPPSPAWTKLYHGCGFAIRCALAHATKRAQGTETVRITPKPAPAPRVGYRPRPLGRMSPPASKPRGDRGHGHRRPVGNAVTGASPATVRGLEAATVKLHAYQADPIA